MRNRDGPGRVEGGDERVDAELLARCRRGDRQAVETLVRATSRRAYALALRIVGDRHEAEDVVQEAYLRIFRGLERFREEARFETWMHRIVVNAALNHLRGRGRFGDVLADEEPLDVPEPDRAADRAADVDALERSLARLPQGQRIAVVLKDVYGLSCAEIGEELGIAEGAVKVRLHRGRARLKELLAQAEDPGQEGAHEV
jgi:RNA polymerase sigma-70 factor (ECF subfamily)